MDQKAQPDFKLLFESAPGLYLVLLPDFTIVAVSDAYLNATMTKRENIIGKGLFEVFPGNPHDPEASGVANLRASLNDVLQNKTAHAMAVQKYHIRRPDGTFEERFWSSLNKPVLNEKKETAWIIHRIEDVTDFITQKKKDPIQNGLPEGMMKRIEEIEIEIYKRVQEIEESNKILVNEIKESEEKYRTIFYKSPVPKWIYDLETLRFLEVNESAVNLYGYSEEEFCNMTIKDIRPSEDLPLLYEDFEKIKPAPMTRHGAWRHLKKNGEIMIVETTAHSIDYNGRMARMVIANDVTEIIKAEKHLASEKNLLRSLIDNLPVFIYVKDLKSRYMITNKALVDLVGVTSEQEIIGKTVLDLFDPEIAPVNFEEDKKVFELGEIVLNREESIITRSGDKLCLLTSKVPLRDESGKIIGLIGISRDITERKQTEILLEQMNESLEKRAAELLASNTELERFAYVASHDLQEPLRMVSSFLELLGKKLEGTLDEEAKRYIYFAMEGSERMKNLIQDLLLYSRVGTSREKISEVDCNEVVNSVLKIFTLTIHEKKARLDIHPLPIIPAVKPQMQQLFQNLVGNALKYCSDKSPVIEIGYNDTGKTWQFYVKDNGIGIDRRFFEKIFVIFQRLHNRREYSGTGIGLAICKKIAERHNGKIWVESEPGKGSIFFVEIPKPKK